MSACFQHSDPDCVICADILSRDLPRGELATDVVISPGVGRLSSFQNTHTHLSHPQHTAASGKGFVFNHGHDGYINPGAE